MGSRDRKAIASLCYAYFRVAKAVPDKTIEEKIAIGLFLTNETSNLYLAALNEELNAIIALPITDKLERLEISATQLFPFTSLLGKQINADAFARSFLKQPSLFLRTRPGKTAAATAALTAKNISYSISQQCVELSNATPLLNVEGLNANFVVQDKSSQHVLDYLINYKDNKRPRVWDCCAASGGKSILAYDQLHGNVDLTLTDVRENIINTATQRMKEAAVPLTEIVEANLTSDTLPTHFENFDIIICDVPCTGSGTWARTPEQLYYFSKKALNTYTSRQKQIALTAIKKLKAGGIFFYITCSVFEAENEAIINFIVSETAAVVLQQTYILGYESKADSLFVTVLTIPAT